ncbi:uncharacterized protein Z519_05788 [Cladophialophora bantiana CBS 173.52]|uniref:Uncharacterized protein n=1 Tax=Cladophialophora bantiana (strain ATCC 10958 / CBS 173.52 / CDC B-1940 / NIH 8579) TaxID=1442370 RepID=A0A0D2HIQ9_CLAB1|nr:uncharacterized protein Z519_05788 [Cladophialophora bantiana CBS 173.52]KIW93183.1 hypothetical protein Z519_05788 [Cladophialophora bantiana CBS 173.52]
MSSRSPALLDRLYPSTLTSNDRPQALKQNRTWTRDISSWQQAAAPRSLAIQDRDRQRHSRHAGLLAKITHAQSRSPTDQAGAGAAPVSHTASVTTTKANTTAMIRPHGHLAESEVKENLDRDLDNDPIPEEFCGHLGAHVAGTKPSSGRHRREPDGDDHDVDAGSPDSDSGGVRVNIGDTDKV